MNDIEKMQSGMLYNPTYLPIFIKMVKGYCLTRKLNKTSLLRQGKRKRILKRLFGSIKGEVYHVQSPLHVEYGCNVHVGNNLVANYNLVMYDEQEIHIGDDVMIGANVVITTAMHSLDKDERKVCWVPNKLPLNHKGLKVYAKPITIGNNVWICSNVTICAGVTIGDNAVIGAGSVVTRDIPPNMLAFGVPCRVVREITEADRMEGLD